MRSAKYALAAILAAVLNSPSSALVYSPFNGAYSFVGQTNASILAYNGPASDYLLVGDLVKIGVVSASASDRFMATQWSTNSFDANTFFQFSLSTQTMPGIPFAQFDSLDVDFALRRSSTGPQQFQWRSSLDNFAAPLTNFSLLNSFVSAAGGVLTVPDTSSTETFAGNRLSLTGPGLLGQTSIVLRLYAYQAESQFGQGGLDTPLAFSGEIVVPEPSTYALLGLAGLAAAWWRFGRRA